MISKLETCKACAGSGRADPDMNEAIQVLLDAQKASMASVSQEVKTEDSQRGRMQIHRTRTTGWELSHFVKALQQTFALLSYVAIGFLNSVEQQRF